MTLQQLEYIVALNRFRHFVKAAEACNVTQPTLSMMIQRLEEELDIQIFDRTKHPIEPTEMGVRVIQQAEVALYESKKISELVKGEIESVSGPLKIGIIPTIAPYLVPRFIASFRINYPEVQLTMNEMQTRWIIQAMKNSLLDMAILSTPLGEQDLLEIPLYYERFVAYVAEEKVDINEIVDIERIPLEELWVLQEGHCARNQIFSFCKNTQHNRTYEAGSIDTLVKIVDKNGGYTLIPELHVPFLSDEQKDKIHQLKSKEAIREVSIIVRKDFIKERLLNAVANTVRKIIPTEMQSELLKKGQIKI